MNAVPMYRLAPEGAPVEDVASALAQLVRLHDLAPIELPEPDDPGPYPDGIPHALPSIVAKLRGTGDTVHAFLDARQAHVWLVIVRGPASYYCNASPLLGRAET